MKAIQSSPTVNPSTSAVMSQLITGSISDTELDLVTGARGSDEHAAEIRARYERELNERLNRERQEYIRSLINGGR